MSLADVASQVSHLFGTDHGPPSRSFSRLRAADVSILRQTPRRYSASPPALTNLMWARRHSLFHHVRPGTEYHSAASTASRRNSLGESTVFERFRYLVCEASTDDNDARNTPFPSRRHVSFRSGGDPQP